MKKVLVYGSTVREARRFYPPATAGENIGYRVYSEQDNGEKADKIIFVDDKKIAKAKSKGKNDHDKSE